MTEVEEAAGGLTRSDDLESREAEQLASHLATWGPHCGAPRSVYDGQLNVLLAAVRAAAEARGAAREREKVGRLIQDAEAVYVARQDIFTEPNTVHRKIIKMHFVLNELRGLK